MPLSYVGRVPRPAADAHVRISQAGRKSRFYGAKPVCGPAAGRGRPPYQASQFPENRPHIKFRVVRCYVRQETVSKARFQNLFLLRWWGNLQVAAGFSQRVPARDNPHSA